MVVELLSLCVVPLSVGALFAAALWICCGTRRSPPREPRAEENRKQHGSRSSGLIEEKMPGLMLSPEINGEYPDEILDDLFKEYNKWLEHLQTSMESRVNRIHAHKVSYKPCSRHAKKQRIKSPPAAAMLSLTESESGAPSECPTPVQSPSRDPLHSQIPPRIDPGSSCSPTARQMLYDFTLGRMWKSLADVEEVTVPGKSIPHVSSAGSSRDDWITVPSRCVRHCKKRSKGPRYVSPVGKRTDSSGSSTQSLLSSNRSSSCEHCAEDQAADNLVAKRPLKKLIPPGVVFLQTRPDTVLFVEQPAIDRIEMNLKHKRIENQWGVVTMYKKSMALMIPKAPPLPPRIKPSGPPVVFEAVDTPFLSKEVRDNLEFHVKRKKLQHQWGLPMMVQESLNAFIPPAPKLIVSELNPKPQYQIVVELSDLPFISKKYRKDVEFNIKRKIIHRRWGYPKFVITSLKSMCPPAFIAKDLLQQIETENLLTNSSPSGKRKALDKKPPPFVSAKGTAQNQSKLRAPDVRFSIQNRDMDVIDRFEVHLSMKCLAIKLEMIPKTVQTSYKIAFPVVKIPLKKRIPSGVVFLQTRPDTVLFMEQPAIDHIEMNLKHKRIENQWGVVTMYKKSMALMIPKAPPLPPRIKPSGAPVVFEAVDTPFLSKEVRDNLEFHVRRKRLQHQWGLPMMVQESLNAFIPPAPKLIVSELNPKPQYQIVVELSDLPFISRKHRNVLEFNIKRKIIHKRWGYPKFLIASLKAVCPPASLVKDLLQQKETERLTNSSPSGKRKPLDKKPPLFVFAKGTAQNQNKFRALDVRFSIQNRDMEVIDRFEVHLSMKCLAIKLEMIPKTVQTSYKIAFPVVKKPLEKRTPLGMALLPTRPETVFFMEQPAIDRIEMNLKHKRIENQWGVVTMYKNSMALMIPKAPPLPPQIKPSGAPVIFEAVDTPFLSKVVRDNLEFHVKRKKLQHQWGLPMMVQESLNAFIPPAPKLIVSELNPKPQYQIVVELSDLPFISKKHWNVLEFNIKRKIIHKRWGYPKFLIASLKAVCPPASLVKDLLQQKETERLTNSSPSGKRKPLDKKPPLFVFAKGTAQNQNKFRALDVRFSIQNRDMEVIDRFEVHLSMKCLAIKLEMIPKTVQTSYKIAFPVVKKPLEKRTPLGMALLPTRPETVFFMEQPAIDRIEMNLKHKRIENQWGVVTMYKNSMALMIPKAPPLPPQIKPSGAPVIFEAVDTPFLSKVVRDNLEFHVKRKKLQHQWGLPMMVQESLNAFIPPAPKLIVSELNPKPQYQIVVELSDLPFISKKHWNVLEFNIKRKIIHKRWGYPKFLIASLKAVCPPASLVKDLLQQKETERLTNSSPSGKRKPMDKKPPLFVFAKGTAQNQNKFRALDVRFSIQNRDMEVIDRFEVHLSMKCLAIKLEMIPKIVQTSYKIAFPVVKKPLEKRTPLGMALLTTRPETVFFMEQPAIDRIEMNLKHKRIENQWGVVTIYKKSMALMIPKAPPLPPRIKSSGAPVVFEAVDTPFLSKEARDNLEFHVRRKRLQHQWGLPMMVQESLNAFIPPAPKLIVSELHPMPQYQIVVELSDLPFISEKHRKDVEFNIKRKIIHKRWGYPKFVITSLKAVCPPASLVKDLLQQKETESLFTNSSPSRKLKTLDKKPLPFVSAKGTAQNQNKFRALDVRFSIQNTDMELIDRFEVHLSMKCLAIKLEMIPKIVQTSYKIAFPVVKMPLEKRTPLGMALLPTRPETIAFMEQTAIDRIEMNLKHKRIENQWGVVTMYKKSMALMIPKAPPLPPRIKPSGAPVVFEAVDTPFLSKVVRDNLEFHVKRKKLQHQWGLPMMVQESLNAFIPPAPKLIVSELHPKPQYQIVVELSDLPFISEKHRKDVEFNIKRKIIHKRWGYPKFVITSLKAVCPPASLVKDLLQQKETESLFTNSSPSGKLKTLDKKPPPFVSAKGTAQNQSKLRAPDVQFSIKNRDMEVMDRFEVHLSMKCLAIKLEMIPKTVQTSYKIAFPVVKKPLEKRTPLGLALLQTRTETVFFMEQPAIDRIEMNLKHKRIENQWGVVTMYKKSMALMIPKAPPLPPRIKPSGAPVVFEAVDTPFLSKEVRDNLEFHVRRKRLQHQWGLPMMVQESLNAFIPPAPKLIVSELHPMPQYQIVVELSDLPFISEKHRKNVEFNIKTKIIHRRWGYPKFVIKSLKAVCPPVSLVNDLLQQKETERLTNSSPSGKVKTLDKKPPPFVSAKGTVQNQSKLRVLDVQFSVKNRDPEVIDRFEVHLSMKCLAIKLEMIPKIVQTSYKIAFPVVKKPLEKRTPLGLALLQTRPETVFFMEQPAIDRIEMNLKHKRIENQWGVVTMNKKSMALMIPKAPPLPPRIKPSGASVVFEAVDTPFLSKVVRDNLEFHVKRKKLQHQWGLPMMVQESLNAFIPPAPKLIVSELNPKPQYQIVVELSDLPFISKKHNKDVEFNIKRKIIHKRWGYPKFVIASLNAVCPPASLVKDLLQQKDTESLLTNSSPSGKVKTLDKKPPPFVSAKGTAQNQSKLRALDVQFSIKNRDVEVMDRFEVHLSMKCLAIKLEMIPKTVQTSYKIAFPVVKKPLEKRTPLGLALLQTRPETVFFMEQPAIDRIEMNLKHKRIENQWGVVTMYKKYMALMIPKAPPLPPRIKPSGAPVVFEAVDTSFLSKEARDNLEFHVKRKKLQHQWGLPMMVQESLNAFIPPAPKLIVSELNPKPQYQIVVELSDLPFISKKHRKDVEFNIKRKIIHKRWGYPKFVIASLNAVCPPASLVEDLLQQKETETLFTNSSPSGKVKTLDKNPPPFVSAKGTAQNQSKLRAPDVQFSIKNRDMEVMDRFEVHLSMKCLAIKLEMIPKTVQTSYKIAFPVVKKPLEKRTPLGLALLQTRPETVFFMEQPAIDRIEMNLKHKRIENQWGVVTMYKKSMALMIPKAPPLPPRIKPSGAPVVFEAVDTPFLSKEVRDNLEFHVRRKRLQHQWGLPMMVQESLNAFIPPAPKLIVSELNPMPQYQIVVELSDLPFISEKHRKNVEFNIKTKIIHRRWGYPKFVIKSLKAVCPPVSLVNDLLQQKETERLTNSSPSGKVKTLDKKPPPFVSAKGTVQNQSKLRALDVQFSVKNRDPEVIDRFEVHLSIKCLAIKLEMIPKIVQTSYKIAFPVVKKPLEKRTPLGLALLQTKPETVFFMEQPAIDRIEMNLKHKQIENQWGVVTMYKKSMALMIPKAPPLPPRIKPAGAPVVFEAVDTPFLSKEARDNLEFHVRRKKLQHQWGLPMMVQESLNTFIPPAPKLIVSELNPKPQYQIVVELSDLPFISKKHRKDVEFNIKRKIIHKRWGYPKFVIASLKAVCPPASLVKDLLQQKETETLFTNSSPSGKVKTLDKKPPPFVSAKGTAQNQSKLRAPDVQFSIKNRDMEVMDRFEVHLSMKCLAIKLEMIPKTVQTSYKIAFPVVKKPLEKRTPLGLALLQTRPETVFFMEQPAIDRIEMNLKHKRIENQWGVVTMNKKSMALMIPKAPPLPPRIKPSGASVVFEAVDTPFLSKVVRDNLEFHVKRKKLQHQWGLPMMVQESLNAFIPPAPKLIVSELNPKPQYQIVVELSDLPFISEKHRKDVEFNIKRKIIHRRWGYPKFVITSLKSMCPPASIAKDLLQQKEAESLTISSRSGKGKSLDKKPNLSMPAKGTAPNENKLRALDVQFSIKNRDPEIIDRFQGHLSMKCLAIKLEMIPKIVQTSNKIVFPVVKIPLKKLIPPGVVVLQTRPETVFFMEQPAIDRIEMNLKHKRIENQWGVVTMYKKSIALMIPKAPPLPPRIKPSGAPVVFEAVDTPFLSKEARDNLEFHVRRKKLQHQWGLPMMVQESLNAFIPPAPKLIVSELHPMPQYQIVVELSDLPFISEKHRKDVEFNIKRKIIHRRWGYPKFVIASLNAVCPPASLVKDLLQQKETESLFTNSSPSGKVNTLDKKPPPFVSAKGTVQNQNKLRALDVQFSIKNRDMEVIDRFEVHLSMKCLAIKLEMKKAIPPGLALLQTRPETIAFMEQPAVDRIEMNLKHKQTEKQRGAVTMYKKSMALMIPKAPPLPPRINHASMSDLPPRRDGNGMASQMMSTYREPCTSTALGKTAYPPERNAAKKGRDPDPRNKGQLPAQKRRAGLSRDSGGDLSPGEKKGATGGPHELPCFSPQNLQSLRSISNSEWKDRLKWTSSRGS